MEKTKRPRLNPLLLLALLATVVAVIFAPDAQQDADTVAPAPRKTRSPVRAPADDSARDAASAPAGAPAPVGPADAHGEAAPPLRADTEGRIVDIFAVPRKPAAKAAAPVAPPAPTMPPFDYHYMGRVVDQGEQSLFFTRGGRPYVIRPGDTLDGNFLFESVSGNAAVFVYVPLSMKTTVVLGEGK